MTIERKYTKITITKEECKMISDLFEIIDENELTIQMVYEVLVELCRMNKEEWFIERENYSITIE